jgi:DNA-binding response OmpR family regulator
MLVNFASFALFTNRLVVKFSVVVVMILSLNEGAGSPRYLESRDTTRGHNAQTVRGSTDSDRELRARHLNVIIRHIGHRLLLQSGDLTSRVLPVIESSAGTFQLRFENNFVFNHDSLMALSQNLLPKSQFVSGYTVTVHDCVKGDIVYGFQLNNTSPDLLACRGRSQPSGCYVIEFTFPDFYKNVETKTADIAPGTEQLKSVNVDPREASSIPVQMAIGTEKGREAKSINVNTQPVIALPIEKTKEVISSEVAAQAVNVPVATETEKLKTTTSGYPLINVLFIGMLLLLGVTLLIGRGGATLEPVSTQNHNDAAVKESLHQLTGLGKFLFDVKDQRLLLGGQVISLTDKECKILELLNESFGELTPRETLMQKVWINEGVITGRSLDMFVSKLRKKLSSDPELRITNVHGKGYTLEVIG